MLKERINLIESYHPKSKMERSELQVENVGPAVKNVT
jgi:hypothetical protein